MFGYTCILSNVTFIDDQFILNGVKVGIHDGDRSNENVTGLVFLYSRLSKIPSEIFNVFESLKFLNI